MATEMRIIRYVGRNSVGENRYRLFRGFYDFTLSQGKNGAPSTLGPDFIFSLFGTDKITIFLIVRETFGLSIRAISVNFKNRIRLLWNGGFSTK